MRSPKLLQAKECFLAQLKGIDFDKYYICIYENSTNPNQKVTDYIASFGDETRKFNMLFPEDEATATLVIVDKNNTDIIGLLPSNNTMPVKVFGFDVGVSAWFAGSPNYAICSQSLVETYEFFKSKLIEHGYFDNTDTEIHDFFIEEIVPPIRDIMNKQIAYRMTLLANAARWKNMKKQIVMRMKECGELDITWKSEFALYLLTRKYFPDAEYQKRFNWLGAQSLDIFIPSLNTGIEYQGRQHYEPVEYFGGEEKFKEGQERDNRKKVLCKENGINLLEWPYYEKIEANKFAELLGVKGMPVQEDTFDVAIQGDYLNENELLKNNSTVGMNTNAKYIDALEKQNMNFFVKELKTVADKNDDSKVQEIVKFLAWNSEKKLLDILVRTQINEEWFRENVLPKLVENETFVQKYFDTDCINYYILVTAVYYMKAAGVNTGIELLDKIIDFVVEDQKRIIKKKENILTKKQLIKMKLPKLPEEMEDVGIDYEGITKACKYFGIKI